MMLVKLSAVSDVGLCRPMSPMSAYDGLCHLCRLCVHVQLTPNPYSSIVSIAFKIFYDLFVFNIADNFGNQTPVLNDLSTYVMMITVMMMMMMMYMYAMMMICDVMM